MSSKQTRCSRKVRSYCTSHGFFFSYVVPVKEPQEAILDSRILLLASNASAQKVRSLKSGTGSFDVDEFVAKLATFMGGQKQVRQENFPQEAGSDVEEEDMHDYPLDWAKIGRKAMAKSRRAPAMSFMFVTISGLSSFRTYLSV